MIINFAILNIAIAPTDLKVTPVSDKEIKLIWTPPNPMNGVSRFFATTNGSNPQTCEVNTPSTTCIISNLTAYTDYEVSLRAGDSVVSNPQYIGSTDVTNTTKTLPTGM